MLQPISAEHGTSAARLICLLAPDADAAAAAEIEALLKQRGYQVRRADEKCAYPPARYQEITLALW